MSIPNKRMIEELLLAAKEYEVPKPEFDVKSDIEVSKKNVDFPLSFEEIELMNDYSDWSWKLWELQQTYHEVSMNLVHLFYTNFNVGTPDIVSANEAILQHTFEYLKRMQVIYDDYGRNRSNVQQLSYKGDTGLTIVKESEGEPMRWTGVPTNKFIDRHEDIISAAAHKNFVEKVNSGELKYPVLLFKHTPVVIGVTDWLAFDEDTGFMMASGTVHKNYENFVQTFVEEHEATGMSHGMPTHIIKRREDDKRVIDEYASIELTFLDLGDAANLLTDFNV